MKGKVINMAIAKSKAKSPSLQTWATRWERLAGTRCQYLVPEITISILKQRKVLLKFTSSSIVQKYFGLNVGIIFKQTNPDLIPHKTQTVPNVG